MYDILQLNDLLVPELLDIAEQLDIHKELWSTFFGSSRKRAPSVFTRACRKLLPHCMCGRCSAIRVKQYLIKWSSYSGTYDWDIFEIVTPGTWDLNEGDSEKKIALYHGLQTTLDADGIGFTYPYMAFHNYAPINGGDVKLGNWHLGWLGEEGLVAVHWRDWIKVFSGWKVTYKMPFSWHQIKNHQWAGSDIIRSGKYYISSIKFKLPSLIRNIKAIVETFEL